MVLPLGACWELGTRRENPSEVPGLGPEGSEAKEAQGTQHKGGYFHCKMCLGNISAIVHPMEQHGEPAGIREHHQGTGILTAEAALWTPYTWVIPEEFHRGTSAQ